MEGYKPFSKELHDDLKQLYSEAMTLRDNENITEICLDKANVYFMALETLQEAGAFSPVVQKMIHSDIEDAVWEVNKKLVVPNRQKFPSNQAAFMFAASNLCSAFGSNR